MKKVLTVFAVALALLGLPSAPKANAGEPSAAQTRQLATTDAVDEPVIVYDAETDAPIQYDDDGDTGTGFSSWSVVRIVLRVFAFAKIFGLTGGLGLLAVMSSVFVAGMVAFGHGMVATFNFLDRLTTPAAPLVRDRMDAILARNQPAQR